MVEVGGVGRKWGVTAIGIVLKGRMILCSKIGGDDGGTALSVLETLNFIF